MLSGTGTEGQSWRGSCAAAQVLWHTAAAFAERLMVAAALPAEQLSEQAASLAADRLERQQAAHVAAMTVNKVDDGELSLLVILQRELLQAPVSAMSPSVLQGVTHCERGSSLLSPMLFTV